MNHQYKEKCITNSDLNINSKGHFKKLGGYKNSKPNPSNKKWCYNYKEDKYG